LTPLKLKKLTQKKKKKATHKKLTNLLLSGDIVKRFGYNQKYI
jgi:hypothetical protein